LHHPRRSQIQTAAGIAAGVIAGAAYLLAQMTFWATVHRGVGWEPLQRIAAMLLGPDAAPPPAKMSITIFAMALLIHLPLSGAYGRIIGACVRQFDERWAALVGLGCGLAIYGINFWLIAPDPFPWFLDSRNMVTAVDHAFFGILTAVAYPTIARRALR